MSRLRKTRKARDIYHLVGSIGAGCHSRARGQVVARIHIWDGRVVEAEYYPGKRQPDVWDVEVIICDSKKLQTFVERLLKHRRAIVTETDTDDHACTLIWKIRKHVETLKAACPDCGATGVYSGHCERNGVGVVCLRCEGKCYITITYTPFTGRKIRNDVRTVRLAKGSVGFELGPTGSAVSYQQFLAGEMPKPSE